MSTAPMEHLYDLVKKGFTDGELYERYRPEYVPETVDKVVHMLLENHLSASGGECDILELGAGTGKFTRLLLQRLPEDKKFITSEPMSDFISTLRKECPNIDTRQFSAEAIPLPDNSVQGIVAAQCFHWFSNQRALDEITRILKPGGNLIMLWNIRDKKVCWQRDILDRIERDINESEQEQWYYTMRWKKFIDNYQGLTLKNRITLDYPVLQRTKEDILSEWSSISIIAGMSEEDRKSIMNDFRRILNTDSETKDKQKIPVVRYTDVCHYVKL